MAALAKCWTWHVKDTQRISCKSPCQMISSDWHPMVDAFFHAFSAYFAVTPATAHVTHRFFMTLSNVWSLVPDNPVATLVHMHVLPNAARFAHRNVWQSSMISLSSFPVVTFRHLFLAGSTMSKTRSFVMKSLRVRFLDVAMKSE